VIREIVFYGLAIIVLYLALQDSRPDPDDPGVNHIYISFYDALLVICPYVLYVIVFANMEPIEKFFGKNIQENEKITGNDDTTSMIVTSNETGLSASSYGSIESSGKQRSNRTIEASIRGVISDTPGNDKFFIDKTSGFAGESYRVGKVEEEDDEADPTSAFVSGKIKGAYICNIFSCCCCQCFIVCAV
jgi:hypothetical protein